MKRLGAVLTWSVISAAFIGPGTVTTASAAGASFGFSLLWALAFSTVACLILQEASGRLAVVSGLSLGEAIRRQASSGLQRVCAVTLVGGSIVVGCAAFEAGNILGGVVGAQMLIGVSPQVLALLSAAVAGVLLWTRSPRGVARLLSIVVAVMGLAFLITAGKIAPQPSEVVRGMLLPTVPEGSGWLILGLIGTTVVPYNLFLGSGLAVGESLSNLRVGLAVSIALGGIISMSVLVVGVAATGDFSLEGVADVLTQRLGVWARGLFAVGLFGAGLSSAITAPLAAVVTVRDLMARGPDDRAWSRGGWRYRSVWGGVLVVGATFGMMDFQPIPIIVLAQALNGLILPVSAGFLLAAMNDHRLMGSRVNRWTDNLLGCLIVGVTVILGLAGLTRSVARLLQVDAPGLGTLYSAAAAVMILIGVPAVIGIQRRRREYFSTSVTPLAERLIKRDSDGAGEIE